MATTITCVTAHIIFHVIKVLYNDYNYNKLIINYIKKMFMKRARIDIYSACQAIAAWFKPRSYRNMSMSIGNSYY